jgi:hypothetical protein
MVTCGPSFPRFFSFRFLGTIKGCEKSLDYPERALDREAYEKLRNNYMVDYAVFEAYEKLKSKRGERDLADRCATPHGLLPCDLCLSNSRTHRLLDELKNNGLKGELVDFVWVEFTFDRPMVGLVTN